MLNQLTWSWVVGFVSMVGLIVNGRGFSRFGGGARLLGTVLVLVVIVLVTSTDGTAGVLISSE